ncbi:hypothetical protein SDC9_152572 [bioreactor metagenome]|uniref:Uncharacterized protein n=1 Tax=bioreactor metagenome TaxID=1076179 RepID=A0A645EVR7_9ZZZZ
MCRYVNTLMQRQGWEAPLFTATGRTGDVVTEMAVLAIRKRISFTDTIFRNNGTMPFNKMSRLSLSPDGTNG